MQLPISQRRRDVQLMRPVLLRFSEHFALFKRAWRWHGDHLCLYVDNELFLFVSLDAQGNVVARQ